ncbi:MAG: hypothetical protein ACE5J9_04160 [Methanosarcinales archaeon]
MNCWDYRKGTPFAPVIEVDGFKEKLEVACIRNKYYPEKAPKVILGRNFLNKYVIVLDGDKICIKEKNIRKNKI